MKNSLVTLLEKVLHRQNELRPVKTDAAMFQFETYNIVLDLIREQILLDDLPIVNAPFVQHEHPESIETVVTTNTIEKEITWLETPNTAAMGLGYSVTGSGKLPNGL